MNREEALAICFENLKGPRNKDLLATAQALHYLKGLPEYGSNSKVGKAVGVSGEMVREFLTLLDLPGPIRTLLAQKKLTLEHGRRLAQLGRRRPDLLAETAQVMLDLSAVEARHMVDYMLKRPELTAEEAKRGILDAKTITHREYHVIAIVPEEHFKVLDRRARRRRTSVSDLVTEILGQWVQANIDDERR